MRTLTFTIALATLVAGCTLYFHDGDDDPGGGTPDADFPWPDGEPGPWPDGGPPGPDGGPGDDAGNCGTPDAAPYVPDAEPGGLPDAGGCC